MRTSLHRSFALLLVASLVLSLAPVRPSYGQPPAHVDEAPAPAHPPAAPTGPVETTRIQSAGPGTAQPFGANLFTGNFAAQREDGLNPDYVILPGDRVTVNAWGAVNINGVFAVDAQGNIFIPEIGPIRLGGVRGESVSNVVKRAIGQVYRANFDVYTNLLTTSPVAVYVTGAVRRPGRYAGIPSDSILFYLDQAGGIDPELGSFRHVTVMREGQQVAELDLYDFLVNGVLNSPQFVDGDAIVVGRRGPVVELRGAVPQPTLVELRDEQFTGADVLAIMPERPRANEVSITGSRDGRPWLTTLPLDTFRAERLHAGDQVVVREDFRAPSIVVQLEGEFVGPSVLTVRRGARLLDLLNYVEVNPELADVDGVHIRRRRVVEQQRAAILDSLARLERSTMLSLSDSAGESQIRVREAELVQHFVDRARDVEPLGRVVTASGGEQMNLILEEGDIIVIPTRTNVVRVEGEVQVTQAVMYRPGLRIRDYIRQAGGYTNRSERGRVLISRPNAEIVIASTSDYLSPGDAVMVLPKIDPKGFQFALDLAQIVYQIAVAASVVIRV